MWLDSSSVDGDADDDGDDDGDEREGGSIPSCIKCQLNQQVPTSFILGGGDDRKKTVMMIMTMAMVKTYFLHGASDSGGSSQGRGRTYPATVQALATRSPASP